MNADHYDLLIVGCGPSGATLANLMRERGYSVAIFDRDKEIFLAPRAMMLDNESCRIFQEMGIQQKLEIKDARPHAWHRFVGANRELLMELKIDWDAAGFGYRGMGTMFHQPALERMLREDFEKGAGVDSYLGYEVIEVDGSGEMASLKARKIDTDEVTQFKGKYIVGADGGASFCRKYIGAKRVDLNYSRRWIVMDVLVHDDELWNSFAPRSEFRCRPDAAVVFVKGFHGHVRFDFEVTDEVAESFTEEDACELISEYFDPSSIEFQRRTPYHFYAGMPDTWRKGRVFIAGDAAHQTSPFSGQGLNMGLRDAANLAFKFDMVFLGIVGDSFLNTYHEERWENCKRVITGATARGQMISTGTLSGRFKRALSFFMGRNFPKLALAMTAKQSDMVAYSGGLIGDHPLAGDRMIQPFVETPGGKRVLMDEVIGNGFALLQTGATKSEDIAWFEEVLGARSLVIGRDLFDADGKLTALFAEHDAEAVLIRPDRYVFDMGKDGSELCKKLRELLSGYAPDGN